MLRCETCYRRLVGPTCPDDGWTQPAALASGPTDAGRRPEVAGFTAGDPLGAGGFAVVWAAAREADGAPAVIKVARSATPVIAERFQREAAAMERVGAPHVPRLYARGLSDDGRPCIVMERLFGETLAAWIARQPRPPAAAAVARIADSILSALAAAHARGVVHRDLKPENIFLSAPEGRAVLLDLGLVKRTDVGEVELTRSGAAVGTPHYMAPEQIASARGAGAPADLYAFGVILYEMLTLRLPFAGEPAAVEHGHVALRPPRPSDLAPIPQGIEELVLACLSKEPERRPQGAAALRAELASAVAAAPEPAPPSARGAPPSARGPRLIAEASQPVVLAAIESDGGAGEVVDAVARRGGFVARRQGARYVAVFSGQRTEDPTRAALAAARALVESQGARAALHLASVVLRRREGAAPAAYGAAVDAPERWMPAEPWSGVRWTAELARALPEAALAASVEAPAGAELPPADDPSSGARAAAPLVGHEDVLAALEASARAALAEGQPALLTLLGDHGLGKTRLAAEAEAIARRLGPGALIVALCPPAGGGSGLAEALFRGLGEQGELAPGARERARGLAEALVRRARAGPVAVVLDDAQRADAEVLDALEYATLDGAALPLWAVVAAHPRLTAARPGWGAQTRRHDRIALGPLDAPAAARLAAELLRPAEYPPAAVLERLAAWSGGNPSSLAEIVRALKRAGVVRRRPGTASWYVATADLDALPPSPAWQWLASRRLAALSPELGALARLCAVLGASFRREELERVVDALERAGSAGTPVDVGYGLRALADERILSPGAGDRRSFQTALFQDALHEMLDPAQRAAVHGHALAYWRSMVGALDAAGAPAAEDAAEAAGPSLVESLEALARHAAAVGAKDEVADALLRLGGMALVRHRHVEADQRYTAALAATREDDGRRRMRALAGRGRSRVSLHRPREAQADLTEARELAAALGDSRAVAELLLEEATAFDWDHDFERSAERVDAARPLVARSGSRVLEARLLVADGRTGYRRARTQPSIELLREGLAAGIEQSDYQSQVIALLLLGMQLSAMGQPDEAEACFEQVIALTTGAHDLPHLCVAYINRTHLWLARQEYDRAVDDMQRAVELARELGNPILERVASLNAAELLYWADRIELALPLARRGRMLEERFSERPSAIATLLLARILAAMDAMAEVRSLVEEVERRRPHDLTVSSQAPSFNAMLCMLKLILEELCPSAAPLSPLEERWAELVEQVEQRLRERAIYPDDLLEILYWNARVALRRGRLEEASRVLDRATPWLTGGSAWAPRLGELRALVEATAHPPGAT